ncbi:LysR substrate-binding domain-containing protein [Vibrio methylphosphonaticus]|uniref:LysR substrate-binding domain-containing protein n=1 Tax=Vibrio methylphosphonaticus TaxID=2946866 RepID=UPI00202A70B7|nr:LysR substrate-binding domain-containing protein [Vibrio methylphosphonaticus]MCL9774717.1 LysR substrate-binding domain-containing protein [Vibrio methylphosphonaticus]
MKKALPATKTLQSFLATAAHLNFTHAAHEMNLTQGAISRQIQSLETYIGGELFFRHARGLTLTPKGERLVPLIQESIHHLQASLEQVSDSPSKVRLNAPSCITSWLLPRLMAFQQAHPDIDVELTSTIKHSYEPSFETFDAVIVYGRAPKQGAFISQLLFEERLAPICRPDKIRAQDRVNGDSYELKPERLSAYTWLHANTQQSDWKLWLNHIKRKQMLNTSNQHFATLDQAMNAALQGFGIAIGDITLAAQDLELARVVQVSEDVVFSGSGYHLIQPKNRQSTSLSILLKWLSE